MISQFDCPSIRERGATVVPTKWEAIRSRALPSLFTLAGFIYIWAILAGLVGWIVSLLLWRTFTGHLGLGHVTCMSYMWAALSWLVPLVVFEVIGLIMDAQYAGSDFNRSQRPAIRFDPRQYFIAYEPWSHVGEFRVTSRKYFHDEIFQSFGRCALAVVSVIIFGISFLLKLATPDGRTLELTPGHIAQALLAASVLVWVFVSIVIAIMLAINLSYTNSSLLRFFPWRQRWTWKYGFMLLPMAPVLIMSAIRLLIQQPEVTVEDPLS